MECFQCQTEDLRLSPWVTEKYQRHGRDILGPESCSAESDALEWRGKGLPWWSDGWDTTLPLQGPGFHPWSED